MSKVISVGAFVGVVMALGLGAACSKMSTEKSDKKAPPAAPGSAAASSGGASTETGPILVGHYASLTGSEATFGISTDNGIKLALEERNAAGGVKGRQVQLRTLDTASKAEEAGTVVTRLITNDKVVAVLGEVASSLSIPGGQVAQQFGVPMISPSSTNARVTQVGDMVFRVCFIDEFQGYVAAKFARDDLKATRVAVLYDQVNAYSDGLAKVFIQEFGALGGNIVSTQVYSAGDADVSALLQNIKDKNPEAIFLPGYYSDVGRIAKQARDLGIAAPFIGGDGWDSPKLYEIGGAAVEGSYFTNHYSHAEQRKEVVDFVTKYQAKHGVVPDGLAALGYDAARVLFDAMERAPSLKGADLAAAIAGTKNFPGVTGSITIDENRNAQKQAVVLKIDGGKSVFVTSVGAKGSAAAPATGNPVAAPAAAPMPSPAATDGAAGLGASGTGEGGSAGARAPGADLEQQRKGAETRGNSAKRAVKSGDPDDGGE